MDHDAIKSAFLAALDRGLHERPAAERARGVRELLGALASPEREAEVLSLLESHLASDDFLESSALDDAGLAVQDRAPMVPVVKLVFGLGYDKTRVAEYAAVLDHARRLGLGQGELARLLESTKGGLKALVAEERRLRKQDSGTQSAGTRQDKLLAKLRAMPGRTMADIPTSGSEITLLVARRSEGGRIEILGEVDDEPALIEKAARRLVG